MTKTKIITFKLFFLIFIGCKTKQWQGQEAMQVINTTSVSIDYQKKGAYKMSNGVSISNNFAGARLNNVDFINDTVVVTISPENSPINDSPWYGFKLWANKNIEVNLKLVYQNELHRYYPKTSKDGISWAALDSTKFHKGIIPPLNNPWQRPKSVSLNLSLDKDTLWVAAQEIITSENNKKWINNLGKSYSINQFYIDKSGQNKNIDAFTFGNQESLKNLVVLSRQHPPEVTGYLAMQYFVQSLLEESQLSSDFLNQYKVIVIPMVNPDGVDLGNWRHNSNGIDLNRDWASFNQPETNAIKSYFEKLKLKGQKFICMIDFHSTWEDIFYTLDPSFKGQMPNLIPTLIKEMKSEIKDYNPNISPRPLNEVRINSMSYFYFEHKAEALVFEIGDNTPEAEIKLKSKVAASKLMKLMLNK